MSEPSEGDSKKRRLSSTEMRQLIRLLKNYTPGQAENALSRSEWEDLYWFQSGRLYRMAARMKLPSAWIEGAVQRVWLEVVKNWEQFREPHSAQRLLAFSFRTMRDKVVDEMRRLKRQRAKSLDALPAEPLDRKSADDMDPRRRLEWSEWLSVKMAKLERERPRCAWMLRERFFQGRPVEELAAETGRTLHAIHCGVNQALDLLRQWAREDGFDGDFLRR